MSEHFDREEVLRRLGNDTELLGELLEYAQEDFPAYMQSLEEAIESGDSERIQRAAHKLKGFARNMGFTRLSEIALETEKASDQSPDTLREHVRRLNDEFSTVNTHITE